MMNHIADDLPRLLTGEATRDEVLAAAGHLRDCDDCREELVSAVVAHASLSSAQRFAPEIMSAVDSEGETPPPPLPDLSGVFETVRQEAAGPRRHRRRVAWAVAGVAAGVAIGAGTAVVVIDSPDGAQPAAVALTAYPNGHASGVARMESGNRLTIDAASLPDLDAKHRYEVWLTDAARSKMQPVGWLGTDGKSSLTVPPELKATYAAIEVSVQQVDASSYVYSGKSVLRGTYA